MKQLSLILLLTFLSLCGISCKTTQSKLNDPLQAGWKGEKVCQVIEDNENHRILKCTFAPGVGHELHRHKPHFGYTLAGSKFRMEDGSGAKEIDVPTGYYFSKDSVTVHQALNIGDRTAIFLIIEPKN